MTNEIIPFNFDGLTIDTITIDGEAWLVARQVATALGYADPTSAIKQHVKGVVKYHPLETPGGTQNARIISEPDVLRLIIGSRLPAAEAFERLVFEEILPTVRKTGSYGVVPALPATYADALRELAATVEQTAVLEAKIQTDSPKVSYVDNFVADEDLLLLRTVAKTIGVPEGELREALIARSWIYEETSTRWSEKQQEVVKVVRYSAYSQKRAYFRPVLRHDAPRFKGEVMHTLKVTPQGAEAIARNFKEKVA